MAMTVGKFRREAEQRRRGRARGALRYPETMREFAVGHARAVRASGGSVHRAAQELGISDVTLSSWLGAADRPSKLREVRVASAQPSLASDAPSAPSVVVTAPSGHVVSGLSVQQAAELLRALS